MSIFNKDKSKDTEQPENTTKPKKENDKISAVQWVKNSGHSLKGVFLEWLSEQELFSIGGGEIKAIRKERKKRKLSPKEKKSLKKKLADLSENVIAKFGHEYLGKDSPEETKEYVKEGLGTIMKQIKTGNFHVKENLFGDDDEMEDFMSQLEDEWDDDDESTSGESFSYKDLIHKYKRGFGEFMPARSAKPKKERIHSKIIPSLSKVEGEPYVFKAYGQPGEFTEDSDLHMFFHIKDDSDDITPIQKELYQEIRDKKFMSDVLYHARKELPKEYSNSNIEKIYYIDNVDVYQDGKMVFIATGKADGESEEFEYVVTAYQTKGESAEKTHFEYQREYGESSEVNVDDLTTSGESYDENKRLYNLRKSIFD